MDSNSSLRFTRIVHIILLISLIFGSAGVVAAEPWPQGNNNQNKSGGATVVTVSDTVKMPNAKRLGINIGSYDQYGAGQYLRNLIPNPGFEAGEVAMLFLVGSDSNATRLKPNGWNGFWNHHPNGFWNGAQYEIISGPARGKIGTVSRYAFEGGNYTFYVNGNSIQPNVKDAVIVRQQVPGYNTETPTGFESVETTERRPGSPGLQSLRIKSSGWEPGFAVPFDSFARDADSSAGKLNIVEGVWQFEVWVKPTTANQSVEVKFLRHREAIFFHEVFELQPGWQKIERKFRVEPGTDEPIFSGKVNPLAFELRVASENGDILIDDAELARIDNRYPTAFSDHFVELLRDLQPGVIRNWGHQYGSTLDNQLAVPWARKTNDFRPNPLNIDRFPVKFHYSLHEFLELAKVLNTEAYYVVPPTWTAGELQNLIAYLSAPAGSHPYANKRVELGQHAPWTSVLPQIHLEFGNEMWGGNTSGDPFAGGTFWDGYHLGEIASSRLGIMRNSPYFNAGKTTLVLGGQAGFPERQLEIESSSATHDAIAVAPYYASHINTYGSGQQFLMSLLARPTQQVAEHGKMAKSSNYVTSQGRSTELSVYEISSHLTHGNMPTFERNRLVAGFPMGLLMPLHMLNYQAELGVRTQAAFTALQYSWEMPGKYKERVKLWGLLRDSEATQRKRPAWLGMEIVNKAIGGNFLVTEQSGANPTWTQHPLNEIEQTIEVEYIDSFAFKRGNSYAVILFNLDLNRPQPVELRLPFNPSGSANVHTLGANYIYDNNEDDENIRIVTEQQFIGRNSTLTLPKHSITVIEWAP